MLKLKDEELKILKKTCFHKGIDNRILNPKSVSIKNLMGNFEETSREWFDGILTNQMRLAALDKSSRKQLVTFDGSIEPDWVENLNSVLDDNMRLTLITGESIHLTPQMTVVLESSDLADTSPATISRCSIIYCRSESLPIKA
jgi:dynein heavy chain